MAGKEYEMTFRLDAKMGTSYSSTFSKAQEELLKMQKKIEGLNRVQSDISGYTKQQNSVEATRQKLAVLQKEYENIQRGIKETERFSSSLENKLLNKKQQIDKTSAALKANEEKLDKMGQALRDAGVDTDDLTGSSEKLEAQIKNVKEAQEEAAEKAKKHSATSISAIEDLQSAIVAAGVAKLYKEIADVVVECTKASIEYESALTGVYKTVDGTKEELSAIDREIKELATDIPATTTEIAAVAEAAGQLGIQTENVMDFTRVMIDLGESTNLSAEEAASSLAKFTNITGMLPENYSRLGSVVVGLGNNFATTEADIVAMGTRLASAGKLAGLTEAEIMALAAAMSSVGIEAEAGGTAMTQTFNEIETAVAEKGKSLNEFARIAQMSADEFASKWESSPIEAITAFMTGVGQLEDKGESAVLVLDELGLTGIRQSNMIKSLGLASGTLTNAVAMANEEWEKNTALSEEANKRYSTTESRLKMLKNSYTNLQIAVGDVFNPILQESIYLVQDILDGMTEFVENNPEAVKAITAAAVGVGTVGAALTGYIVISKTATVASNALKAAMASNPYLLAGATITGVVTALGAFSATADGASMHANTLQKEINNLNEENQRLSKAYEEMCENIDYETQYSLKLVDTLDELLVTEDKTIGQKERLNDVVAELNEMFPDLNLSYDKEKDVLRDINGEIFTNTNLIRDNITARQKQAKSEVYMDKYKEYLRLMIDSKEVKESVESMFDIYKDYTLEDSIESFGWANPYTYMNMVNMTEEKEKYRKALMEASQTYDENYQQAFAAYGSYAQGIYEASDAVGDFVEKFTKVTNPDGKTFFEDAKKQYEEFAKTASETDLLAVADIFTNFGFKISEDMKTVTGEIVDGLDVSDEAYDKGRDGALSYYKGWQDGFDWRYSPQIPIRYSKPGVKESEITSHFAEGTDYASPGWALVGEEGPELVQFGGGERVYTADETKGILSDNYTAVSFVPLMANMSDAFHARSDMSKSVSIVISPVFNIEGSNGDDIERRLNEYFDIIVSKAMDALEERGIDAKRGAYV